MLLVLTKGGDQTTCTSCMVCLGMSVIPSTRQLARQLRRNQCSQATRVWLEQDMMAHHYQA